MLALNPRNIFLFDGTGAAVSLIVTGIVLPLFSAQLGLSAQTLYFLAAFPMLYMLYALSCYFFAKDIQNWMIKIMIFGNSLYCIVSGVLMGLSTSIQPWGVLFLSLEIAVLIAVIAIEVRVCIKHSRSLTLRRDHLEPSDGSDQ